MFVLLGCNVNVTMIIVITIICGNIIVNIFKTNKFWLSCINSSIIIIVGDIVA